jgi:divalent metal cation (Fe/Co/Zn/Cd) transporter
MQQKRNMVDALTVILIISGILIVIYNDSVLLQNIFTILCGLFVMASSMFHAMDNENGLWERMWMLAIVAVIACYFMMRLGILPPDTFMSK